LLRVAVPRGKDDWIRVDLSPGEEALARRIKSEDGAEGGKVSSGRAAGCDAPGCGERRKYRSTKRFEAGGCSVEHLKLVNERLAAGGA
jgi:Ino eighty subunit 2